MCEGHGLDPDERDADGRTALWAACALGQLEEASYLLSLGATLEARDVDGRTPLLFAAEAGNADVVRWCLAHGAVRDVVDNEGSSAEVRPIARRALEEIARRGRVGGGGGSPETDPSQAGPRTNARSSPPCRHSPSSTATSSVCDCSLLNSGVA